MKKVYFDSQRCLGCRSCEFACAVEHSHTRSRLQAHLEPDRPLPRRNVQPAGAMCLTIACQHCDRPACVEACIAGAMTRDAATGEVRLDGDRCIGCWMCVMVCPFDAVRPGHHSSIKCDMCAGRNAPACVEACPTKALFQAEAGEYTRIVNRRRSATRKAGSQR